MFTVGVSVDDDTAKSALNNRLMPNQFASDSVIWYFADSRTPEGITIRLEVEFPASRKILLASAMDCALAVAEETSHNTLVHGLPPLPLE